MIKLIIFDLDGVLVDAREIHYKALNAALSLIDSKYVIAREEHLSTYDGLPTTKKLHMLTENKGLPKSTYDEVWALKQKMTIDIIKEHMSCDSRMYEILEKLKKEGYQIYVASNSIRESIKMMLLKKGLLEHVDHYISNQDVKHPKPHAEMYLQCMIHAGVNPKECLIIEDSNTGREAATASGAYLCAVENPETVTYEKINECLKKFNIESQKKAINIKWKGGTMNVLIPMAGAGMRFQEANYIFPKPLIEVHGKPLIQLVVENLNIEANYIFIAQREHYDKYNLKYLLNLIVPNCKVILVDSLTEGAACTTLLAKELINNDDHLLVANSDQFVEWNSNEFLYSMIADEIDGGILTFLGSHPKWSFCRLNEVGFVCEVAEKMPISNIANVGIYYFKHGSDYVKYAEQMISKDIRTNGEFYVAPIYNEMIADDKKIKNFNIKKMWGLGDPDSLTYYLNNYERQL
jgi:HAD superfamily hydrolase (TIGR01509 family)